MTAELDRAALRHVLGLLEPLGTLSDSDNLVSLLDSAGWDSVALGLSASELTGAAASLNAALSTASGIANGQKVQLLDVAETLVSLGAACAELVTSLSNAQAAPEVPGGALGELADDLITRILEHHLASRFPKVTLISSLLGFLKPAAVTQIVRNDGVELRRQGTKLVVDLAALGAAFNDPLGYLTKTLFLDSNGIARAAQDVADIVGPSVADGLVSAGVTAGYGIVPAEPGLTLNTTETTVASHLLLADIRIPKTLLGAAAIFRVALGFTDDTNQQGIGLLIGASGDVSISRTLAGGTVAFSFAGAQAPLIITSKSIFPASGAATTATFEAKVTYQSKLTAAPAVRFGSAGTRFEVNEIDISIDVTTDGRSVDVQGTIDLKGILLALQGGDGDGFLSKVLPNDPIEMRGDVGLDLSLRKGVTARGAASLEWRLGVGRSIGPLEIRDTRVSIKAVDTAATGELTTGLGITLGPLNVAVDAIGLSAKLVPTSTLGTSAGNVGPFDLAVAFKPPSGVTLDLDAALVSGGGLLYHDEGKGQYAGAVQLELESISLAAIGLISTKLPDGSPIKNADGTAGYSLLIIITATFPPIQIGFGFALVGLGGLLGLNRTMNVDALRAGVRNRAIDSALMPTDPLDNAPQLITSLSNLFPIAMGRFLVGPMARITWGTPPVLVLDLAVLIEIPPPIRAAIVGRIRVALPRDDDEAAVVLHLDVLGVVDLDLGTVSIDATIYDSKVAGFALSGDMALRAGWKGNSEFTLAVGGFHPSFQPPVGFPSLRRLTLSLSSGDNPRLRLETYMAVTSNTVQFGARVDLHAAAAGFALDGLLAFDALIHLNPFGLIADFGATVAISYNGSVITSVNLTLHLVGPGPWHASGKASFSFLFISASVSFDATMGQAAPPAMPASVDVGSLLAAAITTANNWTAHAPAGDTVLSLRSAPADGTIRVHPFGSLTFRQRTAPLGITMAKYGDAPIAGANQFTLSSVEVGASPGTATVVGVKDDFAPAEFLNLSDADALSRPSFERFQSGFTASFDSADLDDDAVGDAQPLEYEVVLVDSVTANRPAATALAQATVTITPEVAVRLSSHGPAAFAPNRRVAARRFAGDALKVQVRDPGYALIGAAAGVWRTAPSWTEAAQAGAAADPQTTPLSIVRQ